MSEKDSKKISKRKYDKIEREKMIKKIANHSKDNQESELQKNSKICISSKWERECLNPDKIQVILLLRIIEVQLLQMIN